MRGGLCSSRDGSRFSPETCAFAVLADGQPGHYHGITAAPDGGPGPGAISRALGCRVPHRRCLDVIALPASTSGTARDPGVTSTKADEPRRQGAGTRRIVSAAPLPGPRATLQEKKPRAHH